MCSSPSPESTIQVPSSPGRTAGANAGAQRGSASGSPTRSRTASGGASIEMEAVSLIRIGRSSVFTYDLSRRTIQSMSDREDLGALFTRISRRLIEAERPLLEARGLTMWQYIALSHVARRPPESQLELAAAIGYDKTRLIGLLDSLEAEGLITREPDPSDRRARVVRITAKGRRRHAAA